MFSTKLSNLKFHPDFFNEQGKFDPDHYVKKSKEFWAQKLKEFNEAENVKKTQSSFQENEKWINK